MILAKTEQGLSIVRIHQDLVQEHEAKVLYDGVRRFLKRLGEAGPLLFRRLERHPAKCPVRLAPPPRRSAE